MDEAVLRALLDAVRDGAVAPEEAVERLRSLPFADLGFARIDHHRALRQGLAEAVFAPGKSAEHCADIVAELVAGGGGPVLLTRAGGDQVDAACGAVPGGEVTRPAGGPDLALVTWRPAPPRPERVAVVAAGTADLPVAAECAATLAAYGFDPDRLTDVGVAGVHRLLPEVERLRRADVVVVVAGMEGALASVVGGLVAAPVVAVPTSVGYGASLGGVTALLAMLASCAAGLVVVGIDNGFGAACAVTRILGSRAAHG